MCVCAGEKDECGECSNGRTQQRCHCLQGARVLHQRQGLLNRNRPRFGPDFLQQSRDLFFRQDLVRATNVDKDLVQVVHFHGRSIVGRDRLENFLLETSGCLSRVTGKETSRQRAWLVSHSSRALLSHTLSLTYCSLRYSSKTVFNLLAAAQDKPRLAIGNDNDEADDETTRRLALRRTAVENNMMMIG